MKTIHKIITGILIFTVLGFTVYQQLNQENELIVGTWVSEGNSLDYRWVFMENGIIKRYTKNQIYKTYNWQITEAQTPGGLIISYLILTNTQDANDVFEFEINALNEERLVLVYQRGEGWGIGKPATYLRQ